METIILNFKHVETFSDDEFYWFCMDNPELNFERSKEGQILIMANTGGKTGDRNSELNMQLRIWNKISKTGKVFDSSTTFRLPSSAVRSPDVAWGSLSRWEALSEIEKTKFPPLCPDFIIELRSESDTIKSLQDKISDELIANGCRLAWLIDPKNETVYIFRPEKVMETIVGFDKNLFGEDVLIGFELDLKEL
ncbi:MAG: Uma2 family endonuclease [Verrucomicrobia bacterium]|nr:Uma2 family endonuclease [Cytophagales bacterium]